MTTSVAKTGLAHHAAYADDEDSSPVASASPERATTERHNNSLGADYLSETNDDGTEIRKEAFGKHHKIFMSFECDLSTFINANLS